MVPSGKRMSKDDRLVAVGSGRDHVDGRTADFREPIEIATGVGRQSFKLPHAEGALGPSRQLFVDRLEPFDVGGAERREPRHSLRPPEKRLGQATTKILGKTPKEIINDRILLEAKRLLVHTQLSIKEIGQDLGFDDPAYFVRYFKKNSALTPVEFRESYLKN